MLKRVYWVSEGRGDGSESDSDSGTSSGTSSAGAATNSGPNFLIRTLWLRFEGGHLVAF
jgi:hypothetical protein